MTFYPLPTNATNDTLTMFQFISNGMEKAMPGIGGNGIALLFLMPLWVIIFMLLVRNRATVAFTGASFITWLVAIPFIALGMLNAVAFSILFVMWVAGGLITFYLDR